MRSTTEHTPLNSGTVRYIYRVNIVIDYMFNTAYGNYKQGSQLKIFKTTELFTGTRNLPQIKTDVRLGVKY